MENKRPTIKDIAKIAGVSHTTVYRALNNKPRISKETRKRILGIANRLKYQPNVLARGLIIKKTKTLGLIITTIRNPFYSELAQVIEETARNLGYSLILGCTNYDLNIEREHINILKGKGVDGIIFTSAHVKDPNLEELKKEEFPFVLLNRRCTGCSELSKIPQVLIDNEMGGFLAVEHLIRIGHTRIGIIAGSEESSVTLERIEGAKKAFKHYGLFFDDSLITKGNFLMPSGKIGLKDLMDSSSPPTAIFALNDYMAIGVMEEAHNLGLRVPEDLAVVGFNNIEFASFYNVSLTTIGQKKKEMGEEATKILVNMVEGKTEKSGIKKFTPNLIIRNSCGYSLKGYKLKKI
ncbi:MAG: LacI family transcriptional regulator [Deltaproteobacteria bacterium]|nr:LacI family DNA-binding transcriptional regulator [Deltaproteobacteria bacterium]RLA89352.1 MAG: LacI family transcriptional regulator [Deltaproteobacteria bacterium]